MCRRGGKALSKVICPLNEDWNNRHGNDGNYTYIWNNKIRGLTIGKEDIISIKGGHKNDKRNNLYNGKKR